MNVGSHEFDIFEVLISILRRYKRRSSDDVERRCLETFLKLFCIVVTALDAPNKIRVKNRLSDARICDQGPVL